MCSCKMFLTHVCQFIVPAISILSTIVPLLSCYKWRRLSNASATFNDGGVSGNISFYQAKSIGHVVVTVSLKNLQREAGEVHIHEYPTPNSCSQSDKCSKRFTGELFKNKLLNLTGVNNTKKSKPFKVDVDSMTLFGRDSIVGRSVVIYRKKNNSAWICANIEPEEKMVTVTATFSGPLTGTVVLRQRKGKPDSDTSVFVDLRGNRSISGVDHQWHVHTSPVNHSEDISKHSGRHKRHMHNNCDEANGHYDPDNRQSHDNYSADCGGNKMEKCEIGDLAGKLGLLSFTNVENGSLLVAKMFKTDTNLPLSGKNSVVGKSIVIHSSNNNGSRLACTNIKATRRKASAFFNNVAVKGIVRFSQDSPSRPVKVMVKLNNLQSKAGKFHIHEYPTIYGCSQRDEKCSEQFTGGYFSPASFLRQKRGQRTHDQFELGDISGKLNVNEEYHDQCMTLFGRDSIVGRSVVIHREKNNSAWICANIEPEEKIVTLTATFSGPLTGTVVLRQRKGEPKSDTSVFVDLRGNRSVSGVGHQWHVHESPVTSDHFSGNMSQQSGRRKRHMHNKCHEAMRHYDPDNRHSHDNYSAECGANNMEKCEIGDLAGKLGLLSFTEVEDGSLVAKMFKTDTNLPLSGHNSVVGRSIVIHSSNKNKSRLACANIKAKKDVAVVFHKGKPARICNGTSYINKNELANQPRVSFDCEFGKYYTVVLVPSDNKQHTLWLVMNIHWRCRNSVCKCRSVEGEEETGYMIDNADQDENTTYVLNILEHETEIRVTYVFIGTGENVGLKAFLDSKSLKKYTSVHLLPI